MSDKVVLRSMTPQQVEDAMARSGLVSIPEWQHPILILAMFQHAFKQGRFYGLEQSALDGVASAASRHFGDGVKWAHMSEVFEMYDFGVPEDRLDAYWSIIDSFFAVGASFLSPEGMFRYTNMCLDNVLAGYQININPSEPVAALVPVKDSPGLNQFIPHYDLWVMRALEDSVDRDKAMVYTTYAAHLPETHDVRLAADGLMRVMFEAGGRPNDAQGAPFTPLTGSIAARILPRSPWLREKPAVDASVHLGSSDTRPTQWADALVSVGRSFPMPVYPLEGYSVSHLRSLAPVQRHGAPRQGYTHSGLDLQAPLNTPVRALWAGTVTAVQRGEMPRTRPNEKTDDRGNFISLSHDLTIGQTSYRLSTEYYHLASVPDAVGKTKLERGAKVAAGDVIGLLGSTGNSTGPHLHLDVRVGRLDRSGRSVQRWTLDPQVVLEQGLLAAMRAAGVVLGDVGAPHLAVPIIALEAIATNRGRLGGIGMPSNILRQYQQQTREFFNSLQDRAQEAAAQAAQAVQSVAQTVVPAAQRVGAAGFDAFAPGTPGRSALELAYTSVGLPGGLMGGVLDALHGSFDAAAGTGPDKRGQALQGLAQRLATMELTDEQRERALQLAGNAYNSIKT